MRHFITLQLLFLPDSLHNYGYHIGQKSGAYVNFAQSRIARLTETSKIDAHRLLNA
jgi:hypothetical protein